MKKEKKVVYGIEITKPWSAEMYDHNEAVAEVVKSKVHAMWAAAYEGAERDYMSDDEDNDVPFQDLDWEIMASEVMIDIQRAITCYSFGFGYAIGQVAETVEDEIEEAPLYRLNAIAEELGLELEKGFVGFS
jgi:hypothetical protein